MVASVLLCVLATELCLGQHWSFGLQPGGKRSPQGPFQEVANGMEKLEEPRQREWPGWNQNPRIRDLKEAVNPLGVPGGHHSLGSVPGPSQKLNLIQFEAKPQSSESISKEPGLEKAHQTRNSDAEPELQDFHAETT
ncbi:hypothetical protein TURU_050288 [Turdus rufiventris]|nr:hypothetical protein TURU_050288 [Turdus rufiventris]